MGGLTVRNLDESVKNSLRVRAARHGWSMEQEVSSFCRNPQIHGSEPSPKKS